MKRLGLLLLSFFVVTSAKAAVWNNVNEWSPAWEQRFADWVQSSWQIDFFARKTLPNGQSNPYYGLRTDCADTVYSARIVFAYENSLPFVMQDPTASGRTLSNKMTRFDAQSESRRIKSFLSYMYDMVSTRSLPNDTYPVAISRDTVHSGGLMLTTTKNHHSWSIKEILPIGVPHFVFNSTVGATTGSMLQQRQSWPNPDWVFEGDKTPTGNAGFRYWRPEAYLNQPVWKTPGYSEEQYRVPMNKWVRYAQTRLALSHETDEQMMTRLLRTTCEGFNGRVSAVNDGLAALNGLNGCMNYEMYDTYSTPNRDQRVFDDFVSLRKAYREILSMNSGRDLSDSMKMKLNKIFPYITENMKSETAKMRAQEYTSASMCIVEYMPGQEMDLAEFKRRLFAGLISNNPMDSGPFRWGQVRGPSQRARNCQSWDIWKPNLNQ